MNASTIKKNTNPMLHVDSSWATSQPERASPILVTARIIASPYAPCFRYGTIQETTRLSVPSDRPSRCDCTPVDTYTCLSSVDSSTSTPLSQADFPTPHRACNVFANSIATSAGCFPGSTRILRITATATSYPSTPSDPHCANRYGDSPSRMSSIRPSNLFFTMSDSTPSTSQMEETRPARPQRYVSRFGFGNRSGVHSLPPGALDDVLAFVTGMRRSKDESTRASATTNAVGLAI
mmetsp:Transcript_15679/g.44786  ORF Transcript_15679/g.44786 Transcript_15679/m.44786 type:complete len:236 (-) Transcript_15679:172-879(-)